VFVEKPLATDLGQAERMVRTAEQRGVRLATNFNRRYGSGYQRAKAFQLDGRFGALTYLSVRIASAFGGNTGPRPAYHAAFDLLIHAADLARFFGGEVVNVSAHHGQQAADGVYHNLAVGITFASGAVGSLLVSLDGTRLHPIERAEIGGRLGHGVVHNVVGGFDFHPHDTDLAQCWRPQPFGGRERLLQFYPTTIEAHIAGLLEALEARQPPPVSGADGLAALRIVFAAIQSAETGEAVDPSRVVATRQAHADR
jgi:predicted dehydrogenase